MALTRTQIRTEVINNTGQRSGKDDVINTAISLALLEIANRHLFKFYRTEESLSTVDGTATVTLTGGRVKVYEARFIDGTQSWPLIQRTKQWLTDRRPNESSQSEGKPLWFYQEAATLVLFPIPDASTYTIRVTTFTPPTMTSDSDNLNVNFLDFPLICWTTAYLHRGMEQFETATQWEIQYERAIERAILLDKKEPNIDNVAEEYISHPHINAEPWLDPFEVHSGPH